MHGESGDAGCSAVSAASVNAASLVLVPVPRAAGVPHQHLHFDDLVHAFLNMEQLVAAECARTYQQIAAFLDRY